MTAKTFDSYHDAQEDTLLYIETDDKYIASRQAEYDYNGAFPEYEDSDDYRKQKTLGGWRL